jgi:hypothetical protein
VGSVSPELVQDWTERLEHDLVQGRLRAEFAHLFGRLLEEWADPPASSEAVEPSPAREPPDWSFLWSEEGEAVELPFLQGLQTRHTRMLDPVRRAVREYGEGASRAPVTLDEAKAVLRTVAGSIYRPPALRRQARDVLADETQVSEYAGVLTILLQNLEEWSWPEQGLTFRSLWIRNKWRPYLDEGLLTLLLIHLTGLRWGMKLKQLHRQHVNTPTGIGALRGTNPGAEETGAEPEAWDEQVSYFGDGGGEVDEIHQARLGQYGEFFLPMIPHSPFSLASAGGYGGGYGGAARSLETPSVHENLLATLNGEIRFHQHAQPDAPLWVVQTDLRDYYLRIPHAVFHQLFDGLGFPPVWEGFLRRYLAVTLNTDDGLHPVRRGVLLDHLLGAVLADWLLLLLDLHVADRSGIRTLRLVDDIYLVSPSAEQAQQGWEAIREFCEATGLQTNERKSGAVCLGDVGAASPGLPPGAPRWGLLRLQPDGQWEVDDEAFTPLRDWMRRQAADDPTVLGMVARYNGHVTFVQRSLGLSVRLGEEHLERVGERLGQLHRELFGEGQGLAGEIRRRVAARLPDLPPETAALPEALFYWPITAGGLGLLHPLVPLAGFRKGRSKFTPQAPEPGTRESSPWEWTGFYNTLMATLPLEGPEPTPALEGLQNDFIRRGGEVAGREQTALSVYWRWIVYTYGPSLLQALGTFRFLLTELVPLQLILENQLEASSMDDADAGSTSQDDVPF